MVKIDIIYQGDLHTQATHGPSGTQVSTDAPKDNQGKGESFSPTDLVATALGCCMLTIMGIVARRKTIALENARVSVEKHMTTTGIRRIGKLQVRFEMPAGLKLEDRKMLENAAYTCPVHKSLHPEIEIPVEFCYPD